MNLSTSYLGLELRSPIVIGASPLADSVESAHRLQDAGCGAIVMRSLFEEQIYLNGTAEAGQYQLTPDQYLQRLTELKAGLQIPVIASLNGCRPGGWIDYARRFEAAGADALELNFYQLPADPSRSGAEIESELVETVQMVRATVALPLAVKLSPYYTAPANLLAELADAGASGFVLFNRLYQPDFDAADGEERADLRLSSSAELLLRLRWGALLSPGLRGSLALNGGINRAEDIVKALLVGAHAVQVVSVILKYGPRFLTTLNDGLRDWMRAAGFAQLADFRGLMAVNGEMSAADAERLSYQRMLQLWKC